ncbi:MAG TPA: hypothetical protein VH351_01375 [Bryobacteraceae bacterium]|jgi:hypothetical protein|nr:hypothetical protein [Bryobacteraceae bacterium]
MLIVLAFFLLDTTPAPARQQKPPDKVIIDKVVASGRCVALADDPNKRVEPPRMIAPGLPPMLSFRYYEDKKNQRFANVDLMLDDAGH